jgi:hypothetical protein
VAIITASVLSGCTTNMAGSRTTTRWKFSVIDRVNVRIIIGENTGMVNPGGRPVYYRARYGQSCKLPRPGYGRQMYRSPYYRPVPIGPGVYRAYGGHPGYPGHPGPFPAYPPPRPHGGYSPCY